MVTPRVRLTRGLQRAMRERAEKADSSFSIHGPMMLIPFSMLVMADAVSSSGVFWSLIPASGAVVSLLHYYLSVRARKRDARETAALPPLDAAALRAVRSLITVRSGLRLHAAVTSAGAAMAVVTSLLFASAGQWLIPAAPVAGVGLAAHCAVAWVRHRQTRRLLRQAGIDPGATRAAAQVPDEVIDLCDRVFDELDRWDEGAVNWRREIEPVIDDYLYHLHQLAGLRADLDGMDGDGAGMLDSWRIEGEIASLRRKLRGDVSADLQRQYQDAIDQYEGHLRSVRALAQRRDLIDLRTKSAASALQQIAVDVSRLKSTGVPLPLPSLRERARELSTYVEDLQSGYRQLDQQRSVIGSRP